MNRDILSAPHDGTIIEVTFDGETFIRARNYGTEDLLNEWYTPRRKWLGKPLGWRLIREVCRE